MLASKLTSKFQTTVPEKVRHLLHLKKGDLVGFEIKGETVVIKKISPADLAFTKALENTLSEWESENDEEAYRDL